MNTAMVENKRRNIAMLVGGFDNSFTRALCYGAMSAAKETDNNLVIFPGRYFSTAYSDQNIKEYDYQFNTIFDYAQKSAFDIVYIELNTLGLFLSEEQKKEFLKRCKGNCLIDR